MNKKNEAEKALIQIPKEIQKLTKVIAIIGKTLFNAKLEKVKKSEKDFEEIIKQENKRGVT